MARTESLIEEWTEKGLLTPDQRNAILAYERAKPRRSWIMFGVSAIGIVALVTGVVSIIAANWDAFSERAQMFGYFALQVALGAALFAKREREGVVRECLLLLFALFFLAGMGLIGQIFHLESDGRDALHFWLALTLPITLFAQSRLMPHLWFAGFAGAVVLWIVMGSEVRATDSTIRDIEVYLPIMSGYAIAFLAVGVGLLRQRWINPFMAHAALVWGLLATVFVGGAFGGSYASTVLYRIESLPVPLAPWFAALLALVSVWFLRGQQDSKGWKIAFSVLLISAAISITVHLPLDAVLMRRLFGLGVFTVVWGAAAAASAFADRQRLFNFCTFLIASRLVIAYFEIFGSLAATGIGLIFSGGVILGAVWGWARLRNRLRGLFGRPA